MAFEHEVWGHGDAASTSTERGAAPGKRMMTDRLQRKPSAALPAPAPSSNAVQRVEDNGLSCDQSFLDSILHGPVQRRASGDAATSDVGALAAHGVSGGAGSGAGTDPGGAPDAKNRQTRIIGLSVDSDGTKVTIGAGAKHGVTAPMQCRLVSKSGATLGNVTIEDVGETVSHAHTHKTPDEIQEVDHVIINATHAPAAHDLGTRILGISMVDDHVKLAIGAGSAHGVRPGMVVDLLRESGRAIDRVTIRDVHEKTSFAVWDGTQDAVREVSRVVVNPSASPSTSGSARGAVQRRADGEAASSEVHALAAHGTSGAGGPLPFLDRIQSSFGAHDVSHVQAHTDRAAADASRGMGAHAFATGDHVAFAGSPDLHTTAHEAAHIVQQRAGVQLKGGVGEVGDAYEQHADAVADAVVRGESAEGLLDQMAPSSGGGVQLRAVQLDDMGLGPAGRPNEEDPYDALTVSNPAPKARTDIGGRIIDPPAPGPSAAGKVVSGASNAWKLGVSAMPHIKAAFEAIQTIKGIWDLLQPGGGKGETKQLPEAISGFNKLEMDRVIRYAVAEKYIEEAFEIGLRHGVHFDKWQNGTPPAEPSDAPSPAPQKESAPPDAQPFINALQGLAIDDLKDRALQDLKAKVASNTVRMEPVSWWWNGANEKGYGEPPNLHGMGGDRETWGKVTFRIAGARIPAGTPAGIPLKAAHFGVTPNLKFVSRLGWFNAGRVETETREDSFDDLELRIAETSFNEAANHPVGAHHIAVEFLWDDSSTNLDVDVTFAPDSWLTRLENITAEGKPET